MHLTCLRKVKLAEPLRYLQMSDLTVRFVVNPGTHHYTSLTVLYLSCI